MPTLTPIPPEKPLEIEEITQPQSQILSYSEHPYPAPEELAAYEKVSPESARLILSYALKERQAYWNMRQASHKASQRTTLFGQILAFATVLILAFAGHSVLENGDVISGVALTGTSFVGLVIAFLQNRPNP